MKGGETLHDGSEKVGLDIGSIINTRRHAVRDEIQQEVFFTLGRVLKHLHQVRALLGVDGSRHHTQRRTLSNMLVIFRLPSTPVRWVILRTFSAECETCTSIRALEHVHRVTARTCQQPTLKVDA